MTQTLLSERLIFTDLEANNNKFWEGHVEGTTVKTRWGRVGVESGQSKDYPFSSDYQAQAKLQSLVNSKLRKGYTRQATVAGAVEIKAAANVKIDHKGDPHTTALVDFIVKRNIHAIEGATSIRVEAGQLTTPLGPVTAEGLAQAQTILNSMSVNPKEIPTLANQYLRIVPRDFGRQRIDPFDLFGTNDLLVKEQATIDSLLAVWKDMEQRASGKAVEFKTKLELMEDRQTFRDLRNLFENSKKGQHDASRFQLHRVWVATIQSAEERFEASLGNIRRLWHGTKDVNLLSLLKTGYVIPRAGGSVAISGRMYGDGIYFSDVSTKSLNYATASAPGQRGQTVSQRVFMFLNDVAMGREYIATHSFSGGVRSGYDSTFAKAGSSVLNNEMIVYRTSQVKPVYLCEFR